MSMDLLLVVLTGRLGALTEVTEAVEEVDELVTTTGVVSAMSDELVSKGISTTGTAEVESSGRGDGVRDFPQISSCSFLIARSCLSSSSAHLNG